MMRQLQGSNRGLGDIVNLIMGIVKNLFLLTIALVAIGDGLPAQAADMAVKAPRQPLPPRRIIGQDFMSVGISAGHRPVPI